MTEPTRALAMATCCCCEGGDRCGAPALYYRARIAMTPRERQPDGRVFCKETWVPICQQHVAFTERLGFAVVGWMPVQQQRYILGREGALVQAPPPPAAP